jgi:hypothetical protein
MFDIIAALTFGAMFAVDVMVIVGLAPGRPGARLAAFLLAAVWSSAIVTIAAMGGFAPGTIRPLPAAVLAFSVLVLGGVIAWAASAAFRQALMKLPLPALVGINGFRIGGVFFLLLFSHGRLSAPFAPSAGWGDIVTGTAAIPLAAMAASHRTVPLWLLGMWNAFGALDLIVAITLAFLSAPGTPYQVFTDPPGTVVMTTLPWVGVATLLVPLYLLTHFTIAARLRLMSTGRLASVTQDAAAGGPSPSGFRLQAEVEVERLTPAAARPSARRAPRAAPGRGTRSRRPQA